MRKNGFSRPWSALQVATWVTLPMLVLQFLFFVSPILPLAASIPCTLVYFGFAASSAYYAYMACKIDPMDPLLSSHLNGNLSSNGNGVQENTEKRSIWLFWIPNPIPRHDNNDNDSTKHCWVCDTQVHEHAMHCKYCDKCVAHFDHHCQWLNTCIGQSNYPYFYATMWAICGMLTIQICCMIGLVIDNFLNGSTEQRADDWFHANASVALMAVNIFFIIFCGVALSLVIQLLVFHMGLQREGLTTYQYIVKDNANSREKRKREATRKQKRVIAISKARSEGKTCLAIRLEVGEELGKVCQCCDPLPPEEPVEQEQDIEAAQPGSNSGRQQQDHEEQQQVDHVETSATNGSSSSQVDFIQVNGSRREKEEEESKSPE